MSESGVDGWNLMLTSLVSKLLQKVIPKKISAGDARSWKRHMPSKI